MIKRFVGHLFRSLLKALRLELLTKEQTNTYLKNDQIATSPVKQFFLSGIQNEADLTTMIFPARQATTYTGYVWSYESVVKKTIQLPLGGIVTDQKVLCTDFESYHLAKNFLKPEKRTKIVHAIVIAPWSHYQDGIAFGGYYDFVILIAAKLCRIKESLPASVFADAVVSYPLFNTAYEQDYLALIGVESDRILDSQRYDIQFDRCILANSGHWFYPDPADIFALKKQVEAKLKIKPAERNRIYISRSSRRKVVNESALLALLKKYDFTIIEDKPRTLAEQVAIYKNASFIIGPHGASFTNIIWCEPGTHLFELFPPNMIVDHFLYLSHIMGMSYSAYSHVIKMGQARYQVEEDIFVSIADLEKSLCSLFEHA